MYIRHRRVLLSEVWDCSISETFHLAYTGWTIINHVSRWTPAYSAVGVGEIADLPDPITWRLAATPDARFGANINIHDPTQRTGSWQFPRKILNIHLDSFAHAVALWTVTH